jgi:hypothetical protein
MWNPEELAQYDRLIDVSGLELAPYDLPDDDELEPDFDADDYEADLRRARLWH